MFRGHIRESARFTIAEQQAALIAAGVSERAIYIDDIAAAIRSCREGNKLVVAGFRALGRTRDEITAEIEKVHKRGAAVMDATTKRLSTSKHRKALLDEAATDLANERRGPRKRTKKDRRMPWDQVVKLYFDPRLSNDELEAIVAKGFAPMSYHTMRRHFGRKRGAPVGRPSAARIKNR